MATVKTDVLPNIFVNFKQVKADRGNTVIPFNTTAFIKTKTGPIGEFTKISSYAEAVSKFGLGDETTPALYGIEQVLKSYGYINIVRLASAKAAKGSVVLTNVNNTETITVVTYEVAGEFVPGTQYYVLNVVNEYEEVTITEFEPGVTYYIKAIRYEEVPATAEFDPAKTYYVRDGANYVQATEEYDVYTEVDQSTAVFDPEETYYILNDDQYEEVTISEFDPSVTYYTKTTALRPITHFVEGTTYYVTVEVYEEASSYSEGTQYYVLSTTADYEAVSISEFEPGVTYFVQKVDTKTTGTLGDVISGESDYKTDIYNGDIIKFVYNAARTRLAITAELAGTTYTTPYEIIDLSTADAEEDGRVLDKLVKDWNALGTGVTLTNLFVNKTVEDQAISTEDIISGTIELGDSGNDNTITEDEIVSTFEVVEDPRIEIQDVIICPEFRNYKVVNAGLAIANKYFYITCAEGADLTAKQDSIKNVNVADCGVMYIPDGCVMGNNDIIVPFEIAALYVWAKSYSVSRYLAPAGVNRGTLDIVDNVINNLSDDDAVVMYNLDKPANPVKYITNYGFTIYGQKTMDASQPFTNRVNVAGLVQYVTIHAKELLNPYIFEYSPVTTFQKVYLDLNKLLQSLVTQDVLYNDYQIICDSSNNTTETLTNHELHASIAIRPVNVIEYIYLDLTVTDDLGGVE